jgi:cytochrome c oxidase subunit 3
MSTIEAGSEKAHDDHGHDDHDHPSFLAHHFDTPEQQFDSGKLGIWLFLVTEILFFGGMFCAYAIFRTLRPDVFEGCSQFLNTKLGAINTGVLLFSSLTMAWAVRCSQTEEHKGLTAMLAATLSCAMVFLGVKAIEYSHKWGMGLLPAGMYFYDPANPHPPGQPNYLLYICAPFALLLIGVVVWLVLSIVKGNKFHVDCAKPLTVAAACFFVGVGLGTYLESGDSHADEHAVHAEHGDHAHADEVAHAHEVAVAEEESGGESSVMELLATDTTNSGLQSDLEARERQTALAVGSVVSDDDEINGAISGVEENVLTPRKAGIFFSIYYCMTGVHAVHILAGIGFLVWLLVRSVREDFNRQYFGPVDYVGLYWHLVDLIWIYLFPLLYLIR